ncbi:hypothetical protein O1L60_07065 [Streptomyces diastatochromogenes]|nr:hypothetical protein [Streptomyces diastatochromogenes]
MGRALAPPGPAPPRTRGPELTLALCHPDGRIREAALRRAAALPAAGLRPLLPLVAIRCADWAEPVREPARDRCGPRFRGRARDDRRPGRRRPADHGPPVRRGCPDDAGGDAPGRPGARPRRPPGGGDRAVRRLAYRIAVERRHLSPNGSRRRAADPDGVVQDICADGAVAGWARRPGTRCSSRCCAPRTRGCARPG